MARSGIDQQIKDAENIDLSGDDIKRITNGKTRVIAYEELKNFGSIDELLNPHGAVVILYETRENFGHWVCLFWVDKEKRILEFFDPYGLDVDEELKIAPQFNMRIHHGELVAHLTALIELCGDCKLTYNKTRLQRFLEHVNTCGRHVSTRLRMRDIPLHRYVELMSDNEHYNPDWFVSALTLFV
jgi:hypothetical protein